MIPPDILAIFFRIEDTIIQMLKISLSTLFFFVYDVHTDDRLNVKTKAKITVTGK